MKKLLFLLLGLAVAVSASAGIDQARRVSKLAPKAQAKGMAVQNAKHTDLVSPVKPIMTLKAAPSRIDIPEGYAAVTLEAHQVWGEDDPSGYQMLLDADATAYGVEFTETGGTFTGDYANFEYKIPENADNDLATQNIVYDGSVTILVPAGTYDYVIVNPTPGDRLWISSSYGTAGGRGDDVTFVAGLTYHYLVALGDNGNDYTDLTVIEPGRPLTMPENLSVVPGDTYANVAWDDNDDMAWNLRWRPWTDTSSSGTYWDFPTDDLSWLGEWYTVNNDTDTLGWEPSYTDNTYSNVAWYSSSYENYVSYDPDNWLISPEVALNGTLSFSLRGVPNYPDHLGVFAIIGWDATTGNAPSVEDLISVGEFDCSSVDQEITVTADLSQFNGQVGRLVFRHYNSYDNFYLAIDNIRIGEVIEPAEWNYVNGLDATNYTIEGLTPDTKYEVQVQAAGNVSASDWTEIVEFTTLAAAPVIPNVYMLGGNMDNWTPTEGLQFTYNEENKTYTAEINFDGRHDGYNYFGFTTELAENNDDGGWAYIEPFRFGAVSEGDFEVNDEQLNKDLSLTYDAYKAFKIPAGEYNLTISLENMTLVVEKVLPTGLRGDVNSDTEVNISDAIMLINAILNDDMTGVNMENANVNYDENVNISDAIMLINFLLNNEW